jgi:hypothetical protein
MVTAVALMLGIPRPVATQEACTQPPQPGFRPLRPDQDISEAPWAFVRSATGTSPLPTLKKWLQHQGPPDALTVRLDDGTHGTLRVNRVCQRNDDCPPGDWDGFWIEIRRPNGSRVARQRLDFWYHAFEIVPVDLVDGPGDELLIASIFTRASPPTGSTLQIWRLGVGTANIGDMHKIENSLNWPTCAWWRALLTVDLRDEKPRTIAVTTDLAAQPCCRVLSQQVLDLRRNHALRFDPKAGRYVLTGPVPGAFR